MHVASYYVPVDSFPLPAPYLASNRKRLDASHLFMWIASRHLFRPATGYYVDGLLSLFEGFHYLLIISLLIAQIIAFDVFPCRADRHAVSTPVNAEHEGLPQGGRLAVLEMTASIQS